MSKKQTGFWLGLLVVIVFFTGCFGGGGTTIDTGTLTGMIVTGTGQDETAVTVAVEVKAGGKSTVASTGVYTLTGIKTGTTAVTAKAEGYLDYQQNVVIVKGTNTHKIVLEPLPLADLSGTVTVPQYVEVRGLQGLAGQSLAGRVPLANATILVYLFPYAVGDPVVEQGQTDSNGEFAIAGLQQDIDYYIVATDGAEHHLTILVPAYDALNTEQVEINDVSTVATEAYRHAVHTGRANAEHYQAALEEAAKRFNESPADVRRGGPLFDQDGALVTDSPDIAAILELAGDDLDAVVELFLSELFSAHAVLDVLINRQLEAYQSLLFGDYDDWDDYDDYDDYDMNFHDYYDDNDFWYDDWLVGGLAEYSDALAYDIGRVLWPIVFGELFSPDVVEGYQGSGEFVATEDGYALVEAYEDLPASTWQWDVFYESFADYGYWVRYRVYDQFGYVERLLEEFAFDDEDDLVIEGLAHDELLTLFFEFALDAGYSDGTIEEELASGDFLVTYDELEGVYVGDLYASFLEDIQEWTTIVSVDGLVELNYDGAIRDIVLTDVVFDSPFLYGEGIFAVYDIQYIETDHDDPVLGIETLGVKTVPGSVYLDGMWILYDVYDDLDASEMAMISGTVLLKLGYTVDGQVLPIELSILGLYEFYNGNLDPEISMFGDIYFSAPDILEYELPAEPNVVASFLGGIIVDPELIGYEGTGLLEFEFEMEFAWTTLTEPVIDVVYTYPGDQIIGAIRINLDVWYDEEEEEYTIEPLQTHLVFTNQAETLFLDVVIGKDGLGGTVVDQDDQVLAMLRSDGKFILRSGKVLMDLNLSTPI